MVEVKQVYVQARTELLLPFIKETWITAMLSNSSDEPMPRKGAGSGNGSSSSSANAQLRHNLQAGLGSSLPPNMSLCVAVRLAYTTLLRVTQLEQQLFESLFNVDRTLQSKEQASRQGAAMASTSHARFLENNSEVFVIIENMSNVTRDFLRPYLIKEKNVDELCKVIATLSEDVRSQMLAMPVPRPLLEHLLKGLDCTVNDAKERLSYCAENQIRKEVHLFEPMHSHLNYPDLLEQKEGLVAHTASDLTPDSDPDLGSGGLPLPPESGGGKEVVDVYQTWYPPMRHTLSILSKLYGVVEMSVFEDFARRGVDACVAALKAGAEKVKRKSGASSEGSLHGDLFLVRHLLILREQLVPFEIRLQSMGKVTPSMPALPRARIALYLVFSSFICHHHSIPYTI